MTIRLVQYLNQQCFLIRFQYILLNNNPDLSEISMSKMLHSLGVDTWGIYVSLKDKKASSDSTGREK